MKRFLAILLISMLATSPMTVIATDVPAEPTASEAPSEPTPSEPAPAPVEAPSVSEPETPATPSSESISSDESNPSNSEDTLSNSSDDTTSDDLSSDSENNSEVDESEDDEDVENEDEDEDEDEENEDEEDEEEEEEHEHSFSYASNNDGTHIKKCNGTIHIKHKDGDDEDIPCDYEETESCEFDEDGICIHCGYEKEKDEFEPSISFSISHSTCKIGSTNPVICVYISQDDYDIAYAQVCFANYTQNQYINVGLAQGKYYDFDEDKFVYTHDDSWYASPEITNDYKEGSYELRSIYIRSTSDETVHYSLESDSLPGEYQNNSICLSESEDILTEEKPMPPSLDDDSDSESSSDDDSFSGDPSTEEFDDLNDLESELLDENYEEIDEDNLDDHEHEYKYTSIGDGTHTVKCIGYIHTTTEDGEDIETACDYENIEECSFDEDGKCIYCGYEEEIEFRPNVTFSSQRGIIGLSNPVICAYISQENYDIAYAQVCYANYSHNKFINTALSQGKYYDHFSNEFIYTSDDGWYASPFVSTDYEEGIYDIRSIYIRSTSGESIHYSIESDTLTEDYQQSSLYLLNDGSSYYDLIKDNLPDKPWIESEPSDENQADEEPIDGEPDIDGEFIGDPSTEEFDEEDLESEDLDNEDPDDDLLENLEEEEEHQHEMEYINNGDGTHIIKCIGTIHSISEDGEDIETECNYEETEECTFDENDKCIYCGYEKEKVFKPSISLSLSNQTCRIDQSNPVVCVDISQEEYDVAYAQICFANYGNNKFINMALAQGKYFDYKSGEFVYTSDNCWYASPNITSDYIEGIYSIRSIYIRSTNGDTIHYSIESDNLDDEYLHSSIYVLNTDSSPYDVLKDLFPEKPWSENEPESSADESIDENPPVEGEIGGDPSSEDFDEKIHDEELDEDLDDELENKLEEHEHELEYTSNGDGTHLIKCSGYIQSFSEDDEIVETKCNYEDTERCTYDENGKCIYCGFEEVQEFKPSISFSTTTGAIGKTNPIISAYISQNDFDIAYAQVCFANYGQNKFINVALAQGKYFDCSTGEYIYTSDDGWYASPNITNDYSEGFYNIRSVYIRSTTGETIHYSIESDNIDDTYQDHSIYLSYGSNPTYEKLTKTLPEKPWSTEANL